MVLIKIRIISEQLVFIVDLKQVKSIKKTPNALGVFEIMIVSDEVLWLAIHSYPKLKWRKE